jgi:hypothetical protein
VTRAATRLLQALATVLAITTTAAGLHDVSRAWDVWYYHLPFAARLVGLVGPGAYVLHATNQSRLDGFPLLAELLQGLAWRLTGRPEGANLVSMASLALYVAFSWRVLRAPWHLSFLAFMAVPLVQIHVTSAYVDLPSNACAAALVLLVVRMWAEPEPPRARDGAAVLALSAVVANMRFQLHPLVAVAAIAALARVLPPLVRARDLRRVGGLALFVPVVGATFLKNAIVHHNPYYPMRLELPGMVLPGPDTPYSSSPVALEQAPKAVRFVLSALEVGCRPLTDGRRWTIDQWAPSDSPALRMGGFFGAYVAFSLIVLVLLCARERSRRARVVAVAFAALTALLANVPQSHELRYYLCWMLVLVAMDLWLLGDATVPAWARVGHGLACAGFLGIVLFVTRCGYVYPSGTTFAELVREKVDASVLAPLHDGDRVCLRREPSTFLYAAPFHGARRWVVREVESPDECADARWVP